MPAQSMDAFEAALAAMREAGVILVPMDMSLLVDMGLRELPDRLFYTFEFPRELSRYLFFWVVCMDTTRV